MEVRALPGRVLGTEPPRGFAPVRAVPGRHLDLTGRHRFSRYLLAFDLAGTSDGRTHLTAGSYAEFPRLHGRAYRAFLLGTGTHRVAVRRILRRRAERHAAGDDLRGKES